MADQTIALDYDGTYTLRPEMWNRIIPIMQAHGFRVLVVTCRRDTEENVAEVRVPGCSTVFTKLASKEWHLREKLGIEAAIWIDDDPRVIIHGH